jgi:glycerate 2-kinase
MIRNRADLAHSLTHAVALDCIEEAIEAAAPETATQSKIELSDETFSIMGSSYELAEYEEIVVVGGGKAAGGVTCALESLLDDRITNGLIVGKTSVDTTGYRLRSE